MSGISLKKEDYGKKLSSLYSYTVFVGDIEIKGFVAIANLVDGQSLGGLRIFPYFSQEAALYEVTRLAHDMRLKSGAQKFRMGGGKACAVADIKLWTMEQRREFALGFGMVVAGLSGKYITAKDVGVEDSDIETIKEAAPKFVASGSPSEPTAEGVFLVIRALAKRVGIQTPTIAIKGLGDVGFALAKRAMREGCAVKGSDMDVKKCDRAFSHGVRIVSNEIIVEEEVDFFSDCSRSFGLNEGTILRLRAKHVVGSANIELEDPIRDGDLLKKHGKIHVPGFICNVGGLGSVINPFVAKQVSRDELLRNIVRVSLAVVDLSESTGESSFLVARELAEKNIGEMAEETEKKLQVA